MMRKLCVWNNSKYIVSPTTVATFVTLPLCIANLKNNNKKYGTDVTMRNLADQGVERAVKHVKEGMEKNNQRKFGQCLTQVRRRTFTVFGNLDLNRLIVSPAELERQRQSNMGWWPEGKDGYDVSKGGEYAVELLSHYRKLEQWEEEQKLLTNPRIKELEAAVIKYWESKNVVYINADESQESELEYFAAK